MVECSSCGFLNPPGSKFCSQCGARLPDEHTGDTTHVIPFVEDDLPRVADLSPEDAAAVNDLEPNGALLIFTRGADHGDPYVLPEGDTSVGRSTDSDIFLDDITVSRNHASFALQDGVVTVTDGGSLNGTYVNRILIDGSAELRRGDEIQIGKFRMVLFTNEAGSR